MASRGSRRIEAGEVQRENIRLGKMRGIIPANETLLEMGVQRAGGAVAGAVRGDGLTLVA
jgi:hypothetical protein